MLLTLVFKLCAALMLILNIFTYFEKYFPPILLRTVRFGRASGDIQSKALFVEVPKSWFTHFYIFAAPFASITLYSHLYHETTLKTVFGFLLGTEHEPCIPDRTALLVNCLFVIQTWRRLYECVFISKFSPDAKMNGLIYIAGLGHYFGSTVSIYGGGECTTEISILRTVLAVPIFLFASMKQFEAHSILGSLRTGPNDKGYKIPRGGLFEYVTCANYFCEILIYLSLCIMFGFQNTALNWVAVWVISNQIYSAVMSHNWYLQKFGDSYPKQRKMLIPFIF